MRSSLRRVRLAAFVLCALGGVLAPPDHVLAGSARDYLNAPIDSWLAFYNAGYNSSVTPEDGLDVAARSPTNGRVAVRGPHADHGLLGAYAWSVDCAVLSLCGIEFRL